ncbi:MULTISPECIES: hypothetical protein [Terrabacteria group]|nr:MULTISPECIES: hypothetical protein [Terrabacteria group]
MQKGNIDIVLTKGISCFDYDTKDELEAIRKFKPWEKELFL